MPTEVAINKLRRGVVARGRIQDRSRRDQELKPTDKNGWYEVTLYEGHNQQIRKMFDAIGHSVVKLRRTAIGQITEKWLKVGRSRKLTVRRSAKIQLSPARKTAQDIRSRCSTIRHISCTTFIPAFANFAATSSFLMPKLKPHRFRLFVTVSPPCVLECPPPAEKRLPDRSRPARH